MPEYTVEDVYFIQSFDHSSKKAALKDIKAALRELKEEEFIRHCERLLMLVTPMSEEEFTEFVPLADDDALQAQYE